ncbi:MAG: hypothetical protein ACLF0G_02800 [Candidatus Brocadiia bacterium]
MKTHSLAPGWGPPLARGAALRAAVAVLVLLPLAAPAAEVMFQSRFEGALAPWDAPADWKAQEGVLELSGPGVALLETGADWTGYSVACEVQIARRGLALAYRARGRGEACFVELASSDHPQRPSTLRHQLLRGAEAADVAVSPLPFEVRTGKWYRLRVDVYGSEFDFYVDGTWVDTWSPAAPDRGTVGLRAEEGQEGRVRQMVVRRLAVRPERPDPFARFRLPPEPEPPADPYVSPPWEAHWIWAPGEGPDRYFRKTVELEAEPLRVHLAVTADAAYELYVNGRRVAADDQWRSLEDLELTRHFRKGPNVIAARVHHEGPGPAGLLAQGGVVLPEGDSAGLRTDVTWRASARPEAGWFHPRFDDSGWSAAESRGKHPCAPWGDAANTWHLAYHGPRQPIYLDAVDFEPVLRPGEPFELQLTLTPLATFPRNFPFVVELEGEDGVPWRIGLAYPEPPAEEWKPGHEVVTRRLGFIPPRPLFLVPGRYDVYLRPTAARYKNRRSERVGNVLVEARQHQAELAGLARPPGPEEAGQRVGRLIDPEGLVHHWRLTGEQSLELDGQEMVPVDGSDGVYWCVAEPGEQPRERVAGLCDAERLRQVGRRGLTAMPVRCKLVDMVDCVRADRMYSDDLGRGGKSRVLEINGRRYRVTSNRQATSYFALTAFVENPYAPHVFVYETPNDIERYTFIRIQPPWDNVGGGVYTGRELPCDGRPRKQMFLFYPRGTAVRFTVSRMPAEQDLRPESGAAVSRVWVLEVLHPLIDRRAETFTDHGGPQRRIGLHCPDPTTLYSLYGRDARRDPAHHRLALLRFLEYMAFVGLNYLEFDAIARTDGAAEAYYPSGILPQAPGLDLYRDLLPLADRAGISVVPCVPAPPAGGATAAAARLREAGRAARDHESVAAVGLLHDSDSAAGPPTWLEARRAVRRAARTGLLSWRGWPLLVKTDLPGRSPERNILWPGGSSPEELLAAQGYRPEAFRRRSRIVVQPRYLVATDRAVCTLPEGAARRKNPWAYKAFSYAPGLARLYATGEPASVEVHHARWRESGIWPHGEFATTCWGIATAGPIGRYYFEPLTHALRTANARDLVLCSWERGSFGHEHDLRAFCRCFRALPHCEPGAFRGEVEERVHRAWDPEDDPRSPRHAALLREGALWVRWFGDRLAVLNDSPHARDVALSWPGRVRRGRRLVDLATLATLADAAEASIRQPRVRLRLRPFELHTLAILPRPQPVNER